MNETARQSATIIGARCPYEHLDIAIIVDEDLNGLVGVMTVHDRVAYSDLPGFPVGAGVENGAIIIGDIDGTPALILQGITTFHETGDPGLMSGPIETLCLLGVSAVLMIGPGHSVNADFQPGNFIAISDHINFNGFDPLIGQDVDFLDLNDAYDKRMVRRLKLAGTTAVTPVIEGVLMWFSGPTFQTPAEARMARLLGADVMGWTIAPEAILARRVGLPFAGIVLVTQYGAGFAGGKPAADQTKMALAANVGPLKRLLKAFIRAA